MKHIITNLNKVFDNRLRLGIMSILMVNDKVTFKDLKDTLEVTDGNLASHIKALEKAEYILVSKQFVGKKPQTSYATTVLGRKAFTEHLDTLEKFLKNNK